MKEVERPQWSTHPFQAAGEQVNAAPQIKSSVQENKRINQRDLHGLCRRHACMESVRVQSVTPAFLLATDTAELRHIL